MIFISLTLQRTFFRRLDTQAIVKFLLTASCLFPQYNVHFFAKKQVSTQKNFSTNSDIAYLNLLWRFALTAWFLCFFRIQRTFFLQILTLTWKFLSLSLYNGQIFGKWWHPICKVSVNFSKRRNAENLLCSAILKSYT